MKVFRTETVFISIFPRRHAANSIDSIRQSNAIRTTVTLMLMFSTEIVESRERGGGQMALPYSVVTPSGILFRPRANALAGDLADVRDLTQVWLQV